MSLLNWFSRKPSDEAVASSTPGLSRDPGDDTGPPGSRKGERSARRELLYGVVRECMGNAGLLSTSYKFKVLSLDGHGRQFLLMIDVAGHLEGGIPQLREIESLIAQAAKVRHGIFVKAVYWRQNEHASLGRHARALVRGAVAHEPAEADELPASQGMLASGTDRPAARAFDGHAVHGPQSYTLLTGFEDTERPVERRLKPLGAPQPGEPH